MRCVQLTDSMRSDIAYFAGQYVLEGHDVKWNCYDRVVGKRPYRQRLRAFPLKLHPPLPAASFTTRCAVSRRGRLSLEEANHAIAAATKDGSIARILAQFR